MTGRVNLRTERSKGGSRYLDASLNDDGDLLIEGFDNGPAVEEIFGRDEYEWVRTVRRPHLSALSSALGGEAGTPILEVLAEKATGDDGYELERLLREKVVPSELWVS